MTVVIDQTGNRSGRLLIVSRAKNDRYGQAMWLCQCDCGNEVTVRSSVLLHGYTRSCGCLARSHRLPEGESAFNVLLNRMRCDARRYGHIWELTREQIHDLTKQPCYYCGKPPSQVVRYYSSKYTYSGVDRKDSNLGYTESNCVPCCKPCNTRKHTMSVEQFIAKRMEVA